MEPWYRVTARYGSKGAAEQFIAFDPTERTYKINTIVTPNRDGELFLYVNDAVIGIPWLYDWFYKNNTGKTKVLILMQ